MSHQVSFFWQLSRCHVSYFWALDLESEVQGPSTHWGNILLLDFYFCFHIVKSLMPILAFLPISRVSKISLFQWNIMQGDNFIFTSKTIGGKRNVVITVLLAQSNFSKKLPRLRIWSWDLKGIYSGAYLTEPTWQVLIVEYQLTCNRYSMTV